MTATIKQYLAGDEIEGSLEVSEIRLIERPIVRCTETWFHVQGGGQKADTGRLGSSRVLDVRQGENGLVDHFVSDASHFLVGSSYEFVVDREKRQLHSAFHTAAHLLANLCEEAFPNLVVISGHSWPGEARVEFTGLGSTPAPDFLVGLSAEISRAIENDYPIHMIGDPFTNRSIQIGPYKPIPCGGTHVKTTGELGNIKLRGAKVKNEILRIGYDIECHR